MINKEKILQILQSQLGEYDVQRKEEHLFYCPFCSHHKKKMSVNLNSGKWKCWVCKKSGNKILSLFRQLNASEITIHNLYEALGETEIDITNFNNISYVVQKMFEQQPANDEENLNLQLPVGFLPLWKQQKSFGYKMAINYVRGRNITPYDTLKYNIGYCDFGKYKDRIIIPSYNASGKLNYFVARSYYDDIDHKYLNPSTSKNTVFFELQLNYNLPLIMVEGAFDAIAIKRNSVPLLGKFIPLRLKEKIISNKVKNIYICLDNDAKKESLDICQEFMNNGINVYFVDLQEKDASEIGFKKVLQIIKNTKPLTFSDLIKAKLYL